MIFSFIHPRHQLVEDGDITMIGKTEVADAPLLLLFHQPVQNAIVHKTAVEFLFGIITTTNGMQQQIVDIVHLQFLHGIFKHLNTGSTTSGLRREIG